MVADASQSQRRNLTEGIWRRKYFLHILLSVNLAAISGVIFMQTQMALSILAPLETANIDVPFIKAAALLEGWNEIHVFFGDQKNLNKEGESQAGQDRAVAGLLNQHQNGFFVDLAANDATILSNTFALERDLNWGGLCIEANPIYWNRLSHRKCKVIGAVVAGKDRMQEVKFRFPGVRRAASGGIEREDFDNRASKRRKHHKGPPVDLYTVPLLEVLERFDAPRVIDYLSLDVEGAEHFVMKDFPFDRYTIKTMTVERPKQELVDLFFANGYRYLAGNNEWGMETLWAHESVLDSLNMTVVHSEWFVKDTKWIAVGKDAKEKPMVKKFP